MSDLEPYRRPKRDVNQVIEDIGIGWSQYRALAILSLANAADAVEILSIGYILTVYRNPEGEKISNFENEFLTAAVFAGMLVGGMVCGLLADRLGRKPCLLASLCINSISGVCSAFAPSTPLLILCRVCGGIGIGGSIPSVWTIWPELLPVKDRGWYLSLLAWSWMMGSVFCASVGWVLLGKNLAGQRIVHLSWRYFAAVCATPATLAFISAWLWLPESPRYLSLRGRRREAVAVLNSMAALNGATAPSADDSFSQPTAVRTSSVGRAISGGRALSGDAGPVSSPSHMALTLYSDAGDSDGDDDALSIGSDGSGASMNTPLLSAADASANAPAASRIFYDSAPEPGGADLVAAAAAGTGGQFITLNALAKGGKLPKPAPVTALLRPSLIRPTFLMCAIWFCLSFGSYGIATWITKLYKAVGLSNPFTDAFIYAAANIPGNGLVLVIIDRLGRKKSACLVLVLAAVSAGLFAFGTKYGAAAVVPISFAFNAFANGGWAVVDCLSSESFPTDVRSTAMGVMAACGRLGSIVAQFVNGSLVNGHVTALLLVTAGNMLAGALCAMLLPKEPAGSQLQDTI